MGANDFRIILRRTVSAGLCAMLLTLAGACANAPPVAQSTGSGTQLVGSGQTTGGGGDAASVPPNVLTVPGLPIPPDAAVMMDQTIIIGGGGNNEDWTGQVLISAPGYEPIQIVEFMRTNMGRYGWTETSVIWSSKTSMTFVRGSRFATLRISTTAKGAWLDIVVAPLAPKG